MIRTLTVWALGGIAGVLLASCGSPSIGEYGTGTVGSPTTRIVSPTSTAATIETTTTLAPPSTIPAPEDFPTVEELAMLADSASEIDAQISSFLAVYGSDEDLETIDAGPGVVESMIITYWGDLTVWDYDTGFREVRSVDGWFYLSEDGAWLESERFEWPQGGAMPDWYIAQHTAYLMFETDPETVGFEEVAGVPTIHLSTAIDEATVDAWIHASGLVMKLITEYTEEGTTLRLQEVWEVIGLDVRPEGPLPSL